MRVIRSKNILFCLLITLIFSSLLADTNAARGPISFKEIGDRYISSFGAVAEAKSAEPKQAEAEEEKADLSQSQLSSQEKRPLIFQILATQKPKEKHDPAIQEALRVTLSDLDVHYGAGKRPQETLMNAINGAHGTITGFGDAQLAISFSESAQELDKTKARQALTKALAQNPALATKVETILTQVKKAESGFLSYWRSADPITQKLLNELYFNKSSLKGCNQNSIALEGLTRLGNVGTVYQLTHDFALYFGLQWVVTKMYNFGLKQQPADPNKKPWDDSLKGVAKTTFNSIKDALNPFDHIETIKNFNQRLPNITPPDGWTKSAFAKAFYTVMAARAGIAVSGSIYKYYTGKKALEQAALTKNSINYLQTKLIDVATIVNACQAINELGQKQPEVAKGILAFDAFKQLLRGKGNAQFKGLIESLQTNTFKGEASFFSASGKVLAAHQLMNKEKNHFAGALQALGELDACLSMAKLYNKMKAERVNYCFVDFVEKEKPYINAVNFWNPFINPHKVVPNSLELGQGTDAANAILTGSNTGGKSTILRALMINLLMARIYGIAPAQSLTMTPFALLGSYLRVNDDTASNESKFKAEVLRAKMLSETIASLKNKEFAFVAIDELFTGTNSVNATAAATKVAQNLASFQNSLYILATHFPALTKLEKENPGIIKNYKVDVYKEKETGALIRPFKIEPGVSTSNVANDILNEEMADMNFGG